jgi:hypothetical protein
MTKTLPLTFGVGLFLFISFVYCSGRLLHKIREDTMRHPLGFTLRALAFLVLTFVTPAYAYETVPFGGYEMGIVVVRTGECNLYYVVSIGEAVRYPVAGSCSGTQWTGPAQIKDKRISQDVQSLFRRAGITTTVVEP